LYKYRSKKILSLEAANHSALFLAARHSTRHKRHPRSYTPPAINAVTNKTLHSGEIMNAMTELKNLYIPFDGTDITDAKYRQIQTEYDPELRAFWTFMKPTGTACFNLGLLEELHDNDKKLEQNHGKILCDGNFCPVDYYILASKIKHVYSFGGDLALFVMLIKSRNREALLHYARLCIDCIYPRIVNYNTSALTISLVQGEALGGGFETALASNVIIAEETARMGFPEIIFNLFPGMGAYSLLTRRLGVKKAEEIILSGKIYDARDLYAMGLIDILAPDGEGEIAVYNFIKQHGKHLNGMRGIYECRKHAFPISYKELIGIAEVWVDAALRLNDKDLKMMGRLVRSQLRQQNLRLQGLPADGDVDYDLAAV
jgi:DSF synthase